MELNSYFSKLLFNLYNVNCSDFIIDIENQYCIIDKPSITIIQDQNELIDNVKCEKYVLGCLDLSTGNSILYQKCIDQVSSRYFDELKRVRDLLTGETVIMGETLGNAMTAEPTGMSLEEIQNMLAKINSGAVNVSHFNSSNEDEAVQAELNKHKILENKIAQKKKAS
jgi:hypothetical protein